MKFGKRGDRTIKQQSFDREKINITKNGKTYNVYDAIQAANIDTDIYQVLEKYNCTTDQAAQIMQEKGGIKGVYGEFVELQDKMQTLGDVINIKKQAEEMFSNLPLQIRSKYGHDLTKFLSDVEKYKKEAQTSQPEKAKTEVTNEQK